MLSISLSLHPFCLSSLLLFDIFFSSLSITHYVFYISLLIIPFYYFFLYIPQKIVQPSSQQHIQIDCVKMSPAGSTRWCPTPEQLMILEEMYISGVRTPNASQIQNITAHLSLYGKIEGKNVFYWFQNHKARERQKLRRKLGKQLQQQQELYGHHQLQHTQPNYHLLHRFESPAPSSLQNLPIYNSPEFFPQGGLSADASPKMVNYTWKIGIQERVEIEKSLMGMYGRDWMMMVDMAPPSLPRCSRPPLKTLELFPITATNLKEECNSSNGNLSCNTTN